MITIPKRVFEEMVQHARACYPEEACGFAAGKDSQVHKFFPVVNTEHSSVSYAVDSREQIRIFRKIEEEKLNLLGIFHSHPTSSSEPSKKDKDLAFYPDASYLILSLKLPESPELKAYRIEEGSVTEEELKIE